MVDMFVRECMDARIVRMHETARIARNTRNERNAKNVRIAKIRKWEARICRHGCEKDRENAWMRELRELRGCEECQECEDCENARSGCQKLWTWVRENATVGQYDSAKMGCQKL